MPPSERGLVQIAAANLAAPPEQCSYYEHYSGRIRGGAVSWGSLQLGWGAGVGVATRCFESRAV